MSLKIPPRKIHLPVMDGIGADRGTNSLPKDQKRDFRSRYLKESHGVAQNVPGIDTMEDLQDYREATDKLLLNTDETLLAIASDQLFLPTYYSKTNPVKKRIDNKLSPRKPKIPRTARGVPNTPHQPYRTGTVTARGPGAREEKEKIQKEETSSTVRLPAIKNRKGEFTKWHLRHQDTLELESDYDLLLAQIAAETEGKQQGNKGNKTPADHSSPEDNESEDPLGATNRLDLGGVGRLDSFQGSSTSAKDSGPWWQALDEESKQRCHNTLILAPELCRTAIEDIQYRALEHVSKFRDPQQLLGKDEKSRPLKALPSSGESEGYDVMIDRKIHEMLGEGHLRDLMDALGFDPGPTTATAGIIASSSQPDVGNSEKSHGERLLEVARDADTGLDEILLDIATVQKIPHSQLTVSLLEEDLFFFLDFKRMKSRKAQTVAVSRLVPRCEDWIKRFIEEKDSELRDSLL